MKAFSVCVRVCGGSERAGGYGSGEPIWKPDTPEKVTQEAPGQPPMEQGLSEIRECVLTVFAIKEVLLLDVLKRGQDLKG